MDIILGVWLGFGDVKIFSQQLKINFKKRKCAVLLPGNYYSLRSSSKGRVESKIAGHINNKLKRFDQFSNDLADISGVFISSMISFIGIDELGIKYLFD